MNPQFEQTPSLHLPQPSLETGSVSAAPEQPRQPEHQEIGKQGAQPQAAAIPQQLAPPATQLPSILQSMPTQTAISASDDSDDSTGLDEEWITKAKQIVERTHTDPYVQSAELGKFKAVYLKSRHNKEVKVAEDSAK
jgi:hypothetical protein